MSWKLLLTIPMCLGFSLGGSSFQPGTSGYIHERWLSFPVQYIAGLPVPGSSLSGKFNQAAARHQNPDDLYDHVWRLIKDEFYEQKYNGQDWKHWRHHYDGKLKTMEDAHKAIETMLASLGDRYTRFLDNEAFKDEKQQIDAHLFGIGVQIGLDKAHKIVIIAPMEGTPAWKAGLQPQDEISEINGKSTKGISVDDAAKQIRGEVNTQVKLGLKRGEKHLVVAVTRAEIPLKAVQSAKMLDPQVGYIRLSSFISQQANTEMRDAIGKLSSAKGLILDLRDNPGGLLTNAIEISSMFLDKGNVVSTVDPWGYKTAQTCDGHPLWRKPLVVLVNKSSASASEITSGALKDNGRALLVGETTYGKGLVQGINRLEDGSGVNVTIAKYVTPNDTDIHKKGIAPDVKVKLTEKDYKEGHGPWWLIDPEAPGKRQNTPEDMKDAQLKKAVEVLKKELPNTVALSDQKGSGQR